MSIDEAAAVFSKAWQIQSSEGTKFRDDRVFVTKRALALEPGESV